MNERPSQPGPDADDDAEARLDGPLLRAYRETLYLADTPAGRIALRVGQASPALDTLLAARGVHTWAYVTAHNPGSVRGDGDDNHRRQQALEAELEAQGYAAYPGEGVGDDGSWPPEASVLVLGLSREDAVALGRRHGQCAVLWGARGEAARLLVCLP